MQVDRWGVRSGVTKDTPKPFGYARYKRGDSYEDIPVWQMPFRAAFGLLIVAVPISLSVGGLLFSWSAVAWFFGWRDAIWPPWPFD